MSEQGCLERVLQVDTRHLRLAYRKSRARLASTVQDVSLLSREAFPAPSNINASEQAISNRAHW